MKFPRRRLRTLSIYACSSAALLVAATAAAEGESDDSTVAAADIEPGNPESSALSNPQPNPTYSNPTDQGTPGAQSQTINPGPRLGGHIGVATPLVTIADDSTTIADAFTMLHPIGISVKFDKVTVDFETVVVNPIDPSGDVGLIIDPGVVYNFGPVAAGLRVAWQQAESNFGLIPLVNKGITNIGEATWFVEAAFPTFYADSGTQFNMVLHSGVGF